MEATSTDRPMWEGVRNGEESALARAFSVNHDRLWRMIQFRLDRRLAGRVDADDCLQEAYLDALKRMRHFEGDSDESLFVWIRLILNQTLIGIHRKHLSTKRRDAGREQRAAGRRSYDATTASISMQLIGRLSSPSAQAARHELIECVEQAIDQMNPLDREVLALRHFEELSNSEVAKVLDIGVKAASIRYVRALRRLQAIMGELSAFADEIENV